MSKFSKQELKTIEYMATSGRYTYMDIATKLKTTYKRIVSACSYRGWNSNVKKSTSVNEELIYSLLKDLYPSYDIQKQFNIGHNLRLDIFIKDLNIAIEYDGEQHFNALSAFHMTEEDLLDNQYRDDLKDTICSNLGIHLIRFNYNDEITKTLLLNAIKNMSSGFGSENLDKLKETNGYISPKKLSIDNVKEKQKQLQKERRTEYLKSERHKKYLEKAKKFRKVQYQKFKQNQKQKD